MKIRSNCPRCTSSKSKKNGHAKNGKQTNKCKSCNSYFVSILDRIPPTEKFDFMKKLLLERISLAGICRVLEISKKTLTKYTGKLFSILPKNLGITASYKKRYKKQKKLIVFTRTRIEVDEMWTFVKKKKNSIWIWIAYNPDADEVVAFHCGKRNKKGAKALWNKIPQGIKKNSLFFTDHLEAYNVIPEDKHIKIQGGNRVTNHIERLNCTLRQRNPRLVRKSLSFSKKLKYLNSSLKYFFYCYNTRDIT